MISGISKMSSMGMMNVNGQGQGGVSGVGGGLRIETAAQETVEQTAAKASIYDNFKNEMAWRLAESGPRKPEPDDPDPDVLARSLTGAMGEIEKLFGREAATEAMAMILTGTADEMNLNTLTGSIQNAMKNLSRQDPNGMKIKQLADGFNEDLTLAFDPDKAAAVLEAESSLSLSYALSRHFGLLLENPDDYQSHQECRAQSETDEEVKETSGTIVAGDWQPANDTGEIISVSGGEAPAKREKSSQLEIAQMTGFTADGDWGAVEVIKPEEVEDEELKIRAQEGLDKAGNLKMSDIINPDLGDGREVVEGLIKFLSDDLQDEEAAAYLEEALKKADRGEADLGSNFMERLSQVYSKVASEMDEDKLATFENYLNGDFKDNFNEVLGRLQNNLVLPLAEDVGQIEFRGLQGISGGMESDSFSFQWGYQGDDYVEKTVTKKVMREDFQGVKDAADDKASRNQADLELAKAQREDEKALRKAGYNVNTSRTINDDIPVSLGYVAPGYSHINRDARKNEGLWNDLELSDGVEKDSAEAASEDLEQALSLKAGQLSQASLAELENFLSDRFGEEKAAGMMESLDWKKDLMTGLADIHRDVRELGDESRAEEFVNFINGDLKREVQVLSEKIGLEFQGWTGGDGISGELSAAFKIRGEEGEEAIEVALAASSRASVIDEPAPGADAETILNKGAEPQKTLASQTRQVGILIRVTA
ncbi:hypothetical protein C4J81_08065 [Deltaproteobacteria bacterium Smac51]|nr:hypothetical protein C4J81_08065 [Deltaproteobacteria bacterium Smac51]